MFHFFCYFQDLASIGRNGQKIEIELKNGVDEGTRTPDLLGHNQTL